MAGHVGPEYPEVMLESLGDFLDALEAVVRRTEIGDRKAFRIKPACD
ncbi:MAG: hypothetical protein ACI802_002092 [Candidatus Paceibacteria bacterium]|jgi:hypothetical protein